MKQSMNSPDLIRKMLDSLFKFKKVIPENINKSSLYFRKSHPFFIVSPSI